MGSGRAGATGFAPAPIAEPDVGEIWLAGELLAGIPPRRRDVGLVSRPYGLWPHLTVFDHVSFALPVPDSRRRGRQAGPGNAGAGRARGPE